MRKTTRTIAIPGRGAFLCARPHQYLRIIQANPSSACVSKCVEKKTRATFLLPPPPPFFVPFLAHLPPSLSIWTREEEEDESSNYSEEEERRDRAEASWILYRRRRRFQLRLLCVRVWSVLVSTTCHKTWPNFLTFHPVLSRLAWFSFVYLYFVAVAAQHDLLPSKTGGSLGRIRDFPLDPLAPLGGQEVADGLACKVHAFPPFKPFPPEHFQEAAFCAWRLFVVFSLFATNIWTCL